MSKSAKKYSILFVCDFFLPNLGGVEMHIYSLALSLIERGHKVVVLTGLTAPSRQGIRFLTGGIKVYHLPVVSFYAQNSFISPFHFIDILRKIVIREEIDIIHGH